MVRALVDRLYAAVPQYKMIVSRMAARVYAVKINSTAGSKLCRSPIRGDR
jgi:hypothetical protein